MRFAAGIIALLLAACAAPDAPAQPQDPPVATPPAAEAPAASPAPTELSLNCAGAFTQGGVALCRTLPGATISVDGVSSGIADAQGWAVIGFPRDHNAEAVVSAL